MVEEEFKSILERKTEEIRAFREELRKKSLEGIDSQFEVLQKRAGKLEYSSPTNVQEKKLAEKMQKGNDLDVKTEKPKISKAVKKPQKSKVHKKPKALKVIKRKIKIKIKVEKKHKPKSEKEKKKKIAHTSKFSGEEDEIKRKLQKVLMEERGLLTNAD